MWQSNFRKWHASFQNFCCIPLIFLLFWKPAGVTLLGCLASQSVAHWNAREPFSELPTNSPDKNIWKFYLKTWQRSIKEDRISESKGWKDGHKDKHQILSGLSEMSAVRILFDLTKNLTWLYAKCELTRQSRRQRIWMKSYQNISFYSKQYSPHFNLPVMPEALHNCPSILKFRQKVRSCQFLAQFLLPRTTEMHPVRESEAWARQLLQDAIMLQRITRL